MKTKVIQFRITPDQEEQLKLRAQRAGLTVSNYIRYLIDLDNSKPETLDELIESAENLRTLVNRISIPSKYPNARATFGKKNIETVQELRDQIKIIERKIADKSK